MNPNQTPILDLRDAPAVVAQLTALQPAYTPELQPNTSGPVWALAQILGKYMQAVVERLNQAPDKNKLAFLDLMGVNLLPAQAARAPLVFKPITGTGDSRVPARTRAGAKLPGVSNPLVFETQQDIALAAAPLVEVVSVIPARDTFASHSAALARGDAFTLFEPEQPILHQLYLAHDTFLALAGSSTVDVQFDLATPGNQPLAILWEFWNGQVWQAFDPLAQTDDPTLSFDATAGLTRNGVVRLINPSGTAAATTINGINTNWVRGSLTAPLPPDPSRTLPLAERIRVSCEVSRPLRWGVIRTTGQTNVMGVGGDIQPDNAYSEGAKLDVTKSFFPLGKNPDRNSAFYFSSAEVFEKAGAKVTVSFRHVLTPEQQADQVAAESLKDDAGAAILKAVLGLAKIGETLGQRMFDTVVQPWDPTELANAISGLQGAIAATHTTPSPKLPGDLAQIAAASAKVLSAEGQIGSNDLVGWDFLYYALNDAAGEVQAILTALDTLGPLVTGTNLPSVIASISNTAQLVVALAAGLINSTDVWDGTNSAFSDVGITATALETGIPLFKDLAGFTTLSNLVTPATAALSNAAAAPAAYVAGLDETVYLATQFVDAILQTLNKLANSPGFGTADPNPPKLDPPKLVWEYWDGTAWQLLPGLSDDNAPNFLQSTEASFTVPAAMASVAIQGIDALWMRVRMDSGSYQTLRIINWKDPTNNNTITMGILEQRPPAIEGFYFGYEYKSPRAVPQHTITLNDFQYADHTADAAGPGMAFAPYTPPIDLTPTLYLGFDGALPADLIGIYFAPPEPTEEPTAVAVKWEGFDGDTWSALTVQDETTGLVSPGIVSAVWPGTLAPPSATVTQGTGLSATVTDPRQAARFKSGELLYIAQNGAGELITLDSVARDTLTFTTPLSRAYSNAAIQLAVMPRFGTPRSWIRVRLQQAVEPPHTLLNGLYPNAVWASQMQTNQNKTLGSSNSEPDQTYFTRQTPVLEDEIIQVRELDGARAAVELPMLREDLAKQGMTEADLRIVTDARSGDITEVWVRWNVKDNLLFSGPDDRDMTLERTAGRLILGDGVHGRIPPAGADNVLANEYRSGGGVIGNVPAGAISQLLSGVTAQSVTNPRMAEAGADGESITQVITRGPWVMRHRYQSVARLDYEAMAQHASPGVAVARAYPAVHPNGRPAPGWVSLIIVPQSTDPQPQPTLELRQLVQSYIIARAPAALEGLAIVGPTYLPVGVIIAVSPLNPSNAGPVGAAVSTALAAFLHPLTGGPDGTGWPFGRSVYLSDIASLVESIDGVDYASSIDLLAQDTPVGEVAQVPENRMAAAGVLRVILGGVEV